MVDKKLERLAAARALLDKHNLREWRVDFADLSKMPSRNLIGDVSTGSTRGICRFFDQQILIDCSLIEHRNQCRAVVLHEIGHALAGPTAGHGPRWLQVAKKIGCSPRSLKPYKF